MEANTPRGWLPEFAGDAKIPLPLVVVLVGTTGVAADPGGEPAATASGIPASLSIAVGVVELVTVEVVLPLTDRDSKLAPTATFASPRNRPALIQPEVTTGPELRTDEVVVRADDVAGPGDGAGRIGEVGISGKPEGLRERRNLGMIGGRRCVQGETFTEVYVPEASGDVDIYPAFPEQRRGKTIIEVRSPEALGIACARGSRRLIRYGLVEQTNEHVGGRIHGYARNGGGRWSVDNEELTDPVRVEERNAHAVTARRAGETGAPLSNIESAAFDGLGVFSIEPVTETQRFAAVNAGIETISSTKQSAAVGQGAAE